uniref:Uncharacterized protein n=1 Tax=viral metagenome TaxID=1070528 RepID=A0A6M3K6L1_9ZZZZ
MPVAATQADVINLFSSPSSQDDIKALALELKLQKEHKKALEDEAEAISREITAKEEVLYDLMTSVGILKTRYEGIGTVSPQLQYWASISGEMQTVGFKQLRVLEQGDLIQEKVNGQTLSAWIRSAIEEGEIIQAVSNIDDQPVENCWIFNTGPLEGEIVGMKISGKKKVNIRKG